MENNVLFVDDEMHILRAIKRGLFDEKYNKFFASSGAEALELMENEDIHVIVTDMKMPKMTGLELLTKVNEKYPNTVKIILSGYTQLQQIIVTINKIDIYKFITKPFEMENEFKKVVRDAIDLYNTRIENQILKESLEKKNILYQNMLRTNSEKMDVVKSSYKFIKSFSHVFSNYYYLLAIKLKRDIIDADKLQEELLLIQELFEKVIGMMPTSYKEFNKQSLVSMKVLNNAHIYHMNEKRVYLGNFNFIEFALITIVSMYFKFEKDSDIEISVKEKNKLGSKVELLFALKVNNNEITADKTRIASLKIFFTCLLEGFDGLFSLEEIGSDHICFIKIPVEIVKKVEDENG